MRLLKFPVLSITISFAIGIFINHFFEPPFYSLLIVTSLLFINFIVAFFRSRQILFQDVVFGVSCYLFVSSIGAFTHYLHSEINFKNHYSNYISNDKSEVIGTISSILKPSQKYNRYIVNVKEYEHKKVVGKLLLYQLKSDEVILKTSQTIWIFKEIKPTLQTINPYQFDYSKYLEKQNIYHLVYCNTTDIITIGTTKNFEYHLQQLRDKLSESFSIHHFSEKQKAIVDALLFGQRLFMDKETTNNYSKAGVIHILAISGLHIGILFAFLSFLLQPLGRFMFGKLLKLIIILAFLWIFALITGMPASVTRAVTLFSFISIGNYFNQQNSVFNAVGVSALILLIFNPNFLFDIGFQLSYAAVISILLFQPFYKKFYFSKNIISTYFVDIVLVSLAAQIGVLPLSLYYFNQLPMLFLVANIVVIPLASFVLIFGSITLFFNFVFQPIAIFIGKLLAYVITEMNRYIAFISKVENGIIENISFTALLALSMYLIIIAFIYWLYNLKWYSFRNLIFTFLLFQMLYIFIKWDANTSTELVIFNSKKTLLSNKENSDLKIVTNYKEANGSMINDYARGSFSDEIEIIPVKNCISFQDKRILVIDSFSIYKTKLKPHVVFLCQSPKVNLERIIKEVKPKVIVADNSNPLYKLKAWKITCEKEKIPFHATAEKGFYRLK